MTVACPSYELIEDQDSCFQYREHDAFSDLIRWHYHEEYELHLIVSSRGKTFVGDFVGTFEPGCLILTGPNLPHNWISKTEITSGIRDRVINFTHEFMESLMKVVPEAELMRRMLAEARYGIQFTPHTSECVTPWIQLLSQQTGLRRFVTLLQIMEHLAASEAYARLSTRQYDDDHDPQTLERINRVVNYMTEHYTSECRLADVAAQIHLNPEVFSRFFHRATGHRFKEFLTRLRIGKACEYLESTDWPITNICYEVGFRNLSNFNRRFLEIKEMTPTEYRRNIAERDRRSTHHILL